MAGSFIASDFDQRMETDTVQVGAKATNSRTGSTWELVELSDTTFVVRYSVPSGIKKPEVAEHYHVGWHEEFHVKSGNAFYELDGKEGVASAGEIIVMPQRVKHVHPYSSSEEALVIEQHGIVSNHAPNAITETLGFFFTMFEWEADGRIKLDKTGLPRHPMKFALAGRVLGRAGGYDARIPKPIADFGSATFGRLSEVLGYSVIDPKWR